MAITNPALTLCAAPLFAAIKPVVDTLNKIGATDFAASDPDLKDVTAVGGEIKIPVSSIATASVFNAETNNYLTGGDTDWATLTCAHYFQGFPIKGVDVDNGVNAERMKSLFALRAAAGIKGAVQKSVRESLDGATESTGVVLPEYTSAAAEDYMNLAADLAWLDKSDSALAVNGATLANIKKVFADEHVVADLAGLAGMMGFRDLVLVPGMTARAVVVPATSVGFLGRVPTIQEMATLKASVETDPETGFSIGITVASSAGPNEIVVGADFWFGALVHSANAAATEAGVIKIA